MPALAPLADEGWCARQFVPIVARQNTHAAHQSIAPSTVTPDRSPTPEHARGLSASGGGESPSRTPMTHSLIDQ